MKNTELRNSHRWDSPKQRLRKSASEKPTLERGGDARTSPSVPLQEPLKKERRCGQLLNVTDTSTWSLDLSIIRRPATLKGRDSKDDGQKPDYIGLKTEGREGEGQSVQILSRNLL